MCEVTDYSDSDSSSDLEVKSGILPKVEVLDFNFPCQKVCSRYMGDNVASSSGSNLRSSLVGMGFAPVLVDRVIEEKGEYNIDLLLEALFACTSLQKSCSESSDSLDRLFGDDKDTCRQASISTELFPKVESDVLSGVNEDKRASLLMMKFSMDEVDFALYKLGDDAPVDELVDFIFAARIAETTDRNVDDSRHYGKGKKEESNTEALFSTMDKTLRLLEMGFSEHEVSVAIEKYGSETTVAQLADAIAAGQTGGTCFESEEYDSTSFGTYYSDTVTHGSQHRTVNAGINQHLFSSVKIKTENSVPDAFCQFRDTNSMDQYKGKRPKEEYFDELNGLKRPKEEYDDDLTSSVGPTWLDAGNGSCAFDWIPVEHKKLQKRARQGEGSGITKISKPHSCDSLNWMVGKPPYFFFGDVMNLSRDSWVKISQFLYAIEPEFANTQLFSALSRREGYIHNLPTQNRLHILPKSPLSIEEAVPLSENWWPYWDTRKQLDGINSKSYGISQLCDKIEKMLLDCGGTLSAEQQRQLLHRCRTLNLVWVGRYKLAPLEPEHFEVIMGYPLHHTEISGCSPLERLELLKSGFQTDTLGYHISTLKSLFTEGMTVLSIYSGIGGVEISLHRLGIHLKAVVSIEPSATKRRLLRTWWKKSGQSGELMQIEEIQKLASNKLDDLIKKYGGFDFIICQNPNSERCSDDGGDGFTSLDFSMFYEFVRVLQRVRISMERNK